MSVKEASSFPGVLTDLRYLRFGFGGGLGTPVVSYAPRPMLVAVFSLEIISSVVLVLWL